MGIHEQNYVRYEGRLQEKRAALSIARASLRTYWSLTRTKLVLLLLWLMPLGAIVGVLLEYVFRNSSMGSMTGAVESAPGANPIAIFVQLSLVSLALLLMASGCGVISDDLRYKTFQLYFSKPLSKVDYGVGKFLGLFALGSLITLVPALLVGGLRLAFALRSEFAGVIAQQIGVGFGILTLGTAIFCAIVMGLSAMTAHTRYVVLSWLGLLMVPSLIGTIINLATEGNKAADLVSLTGNVWLVSEILLLKEEVPFPLIAPLGILLLAGALGVGALARRISRLEGVA